MIGRRFMDGNGKYSIFVLRYFLCADSPWEDVSREHILRPLHYKKSGKGHLHVMKL